MNILVHVIVLPYWVYNFTRQYLSQKKKPVNFHSNSELQCLLKVSRKILISVYGIYVYTCSSVAHVYGGQRVMSSSVTQPILETGSPAEPEACSFSLGGWPGSSWSCLSLPPECWGYRHRAPTPGLLPPACPTSTFLIDTFPILQDPCHKSLPNRATN